MCVSTYNATGSLELDWTGVLDMEAGRQAGRHDEAKEKEPRDGVGHTCKVAERQSSSFLSEL